LNTQETLVLTPEYEHLKSELLQTIKQFDQFGHVLQQERNTIRRGLIGGVDVTIKSYKKPNFLQGLIYGLLRPSKAKRSFLFARTLIQKFIGTAEPIAYVEHHQGKRLSSSYFVSRYVEHDFTIREVLKNQISDKATIFKGFVEFTLKLHNSNVLHLDHSPGNTLIRKTDNGYEYSIIDINRMRFKTLNLNERLKNFIRLTTHERDLEALIPIYADLINENKEKCLHQVKQLANKRRSAVNRKRKLKALLRIVNPKHA